MNENEGAWINQGPPEDLVARLRKYGTTLEGPVPVVMEAADEIERLRAEVKGEKSRPLA